MADTIKVNGFLPFRFNVETGEWEMEMKGLLARFVFTGLDDEKRLDEVLAELQGSAANINASLGNKVDTEEFRKELAALKTGMNSYEGRIMRLEESLYNDLTQNPWAAGFDGLDGFEVQGFVWNKALARLEV